MMRKKSMIDKKLGAAVEALQEVGNGHHSGTVGDQQHILEKLIQDNLYTTISTRATLNATGTFSPHDNSSTPLQVSGIEELMKNAIKASVSEAVPKSTSPELMLHGLLLNLNRKSSDRIVQDILTVIMNRTRSVDNPVEAELSPEDSTYIDIIVNHVSNIEGVTKVQVLEESFPDSASIIVKLDLDNFTEYEQSKVLSTIDDIITVNKPKALDRLEVIYHNKVVYV